LNRDERARNVQPVTRAQILSVQLNKE
jgi:hypothetical protein